MTEPTTSNTKRVVLGLCAAATAILVLGLAVWLAKRTPAEPGAPVADGEQPIASSSGTAIYGAPSVGEPVVMKALRSAPTPSIIIEVVDPAAVHRAIKNNEWLGRVLEAPLGRGFLGSWAGFLGTRGEDVKADFSGRVIDFLAEKVLNAPFRLVWFSGSKITGVPAVVLEEPNGAAGAAFTLLDGVAGRGTLTVERCVDADSPNDDAEGAEASAAVKVRALESLTIRRWLLADHAVYAAIAGDRMVLSRRPAAVLQGLCAELPEAAPVAGAAVQVEMLSQTLGRGAQIFPQLLGVESAPRLVFGVDNDRLVPRGLAGGLGEVVHLGAAKPDAQLLRLIPEAAPVVLVAQLELPKVLDAETLQRFLQGVKTDNRERQVAIVWYPRGDGGMESELSLVWSRTEDDAAVANLFPGLIPAGEAVCGQLLLSTTAAMNERLRDTCRGKTPSLLQAAPPVVSGFKESMSLGLGLNLGQLLRTLTHDAYVGENQGQKALPAEVQEVERQLAELPYFGLRGVKQGEALVPGGFRS